jgi:hypothetical protein
MMPAGVGQKPSHPIFFQLFFEPQILLNAARFLEEVISPFPPHRSIIDLSLIHRPIPPELQAGDVDFHIDLLEGADDET